MNFTDSEIEAYALDHTDPETDLLQQVSRETHLEVLNPRMLSGHLQGRLLAMFSKMIRPEAILEIGTYTGYSAICLAEGLPDNGILHTIEANEELEERVMKYIGRAGLTKKVQLHIGDARDLIPGLDVTFDLVFMDANKAHYGEYYELVYPKVKSGGYIIVDNVLWSGKVLEDKKDKDTRAIVDFNTTIQKDARVEKIMLPVRDGLLIIRKK